MRLTNEGEHHGDCDDERCGEGCASFSVSVQQMPLSFLKEGESAHVVKVRGRGDLQHHLENLGFVEGAEVKVVSGGGDLIVSVKGAQVAIGRQAASHIITSAATA